MPDVYGFQLHAELRKAFDVWSGCLKNRTREDPGTRARLRARVCMALDLAHATAARREFERLEALARRLGVKP
ncbi:MULTISPECIES: hypothetical protein [Streptomyces]|uniref:hypothetical protein n=1 Tax=Streptomyces TaxID=1883 RepID=UPI001FAB922C|nr:MULTISPECIES: hypothetical protein [Streptomyces]